MERSKAANDFINNVAKRFNFDLVLKPSMLLIISLVPLILGTTFAISLEYILCMFFETAQEFGKVALVGLTTAAITEISIISFLILTVNYYSRSHIVRDRRWMASLCDYVKEHGGDTSKMEDIVKNRAVIKGDLSRKFSFITWVLTALIFIVFGYFLYKSSVDAVYSNFESLGRYILTPLLLLLLLQLIITLKSTFILPTEQDKRQVDFTEELKVQCKSFGLEIYAMEPSFKWKSFKWIHIVLTVVTFGVYAIFYLMMSCRKMNKHILNQWSYEDYLLDKIMEFEGGVGARVIVDGSRDTTLEEKLLGLLSS